MLQPPDRASQADVKRRLGQYSLRIVAQFDQSLLLVPGQWTFQVAYDPHKLQTSLTCITREQLQEDAETATRTTGPLELWFPTCYRYSDKRVDGYCTTIRYSMLALRTLCAENVRDNRELLCPCP